MNTEPLTCAIIGHLVGDYLLQNDWMANGKKTWNGSRQCDVHCLLWTLSVMFFAEWFTTFNRSMAIFAVLFWTHYIQDRTQIIGWWMRLIRQHKFAEPPCAPWSIIVVDNVWHIVTLWAVWRFLA
jgi:hypothetical protein